MMFVRERQQVVGDIVTRLSLGEVIDGRHVQQHFEIECGIGLKRAQDLFDVLALYCNGEIAAKLAHVKEIVCKALIESSRDRPLHVLILLEETDNGTWRSLQ